MLGRKEYSVSVNGQKNLSLDDVMGKFLGKSVENYSGFKDGQPSYVNQINLRTALSQISDSGSFSHYLLSKSAPSGDRAKFTISAIGMDNKQIGKLRGIIDYKYS